MHVTIWQQWSSNHSAMYAIVGEFVSAEAAEAAATTLRGITAAIAQWFKERRGKRGEDPAFPLGPEGPWAEQAARNWGDYLRSTFDLFGSLPPNIVVWDRVVMVSMLEGQGFTYLREIADYRVLGDLGGRSAVDAEGEGGTDSVAAIHVTCQASDEATAVALKQEIRPALEPETLRWTDERPPWDPDGVLEDDGGEGIIEREGTLLSLRVRFFGHTPEGLAALTHYLRTRGCTGLEYVLEEVRPRVWEAWMAAERFINPQDVPDPSAPMLLTIMAVAPSPLVALMIKETLDAEAPDVHGRAADSHLPDVATVNGVHLTFTLQVLQRDVAELTDQIRAYLEGEGCKVVMQTVGKAAPLDAG